MRDDDVELLVRERRSLDILSVKKEARLSARALAEVKVSRGEVTFATDVEDYQKMKRLGWSNTAFWMLE